MYYLGYLLNEGGKKETNAAHLIHHPFFPFFFGKKHYAQFSPAPIVADLPDQPILKTTFHAGSASSYHAEYSLDSKEVVNCSGILQICKSAGPQSETKMFGLVQFPLSTTVRV